ncbi:MAG: DUF3105 domain-containing protein [Patescibacteria group bacterium]
MKKFVVWLLILGIIVGIIFWIKNKQSNSPEIEIGQKAEDLGREHVTDIYGKSYSSNPPTSGPHFPVWAKKGIYDRLLSDGYLIHSLEHGYIIISYNCSFNPQTNTFVKEVLAHDEPAVLSPDSKTPLMHMLFDLKNEQEAWFRPQNPPAVEVELPPEFTSDQCRSLVESLKIYLDEKERVIIVPRVDMETRIALTAWARILKLNDIEDTKIKEFINTYHNKAPEKTVE